MGNPRKYFPLLAAAGLLASGAAQATLYDRGGGLLYDDVLKVTWLQDANYAKTSGYNADGKMNWADAKTWAANLVYHDSVRGVDWTGWRLPVVVETGPPGCDGDYNGSECNYHVPTGVGSAGYSELAYMYFVNLGLKAYWSPAGDFQSDWGIFGNGTYGDQADVGVVKNLQSSAYWSGTAYALHPAIAAWYFSAYDGSQGAGNREDNRMHAWAVRCGDVAAVPAMTCDYLPPEFPAPAPVPEPETYALFMAGLAVMGCAVRRRRGFGPA